MDNKKRLFEVMMKVNPSFRRINEIGAKMAGIAIHKNLINNDLRTQRITRDAITTLFSKYLGKDIPFFLKVRDTDQPTKFQLIEATFGRDFNLRTEYSDSEKGGDYVLKLHFYNPTGEDNDAPYGENKKEFTSSYILSKDSYDDITKQYFYNQYAINLFLFAALTIRKAYFNAFPIYTNNGVSGHEINQAHTEAAMKTNLNKSSFKQFSYDSKNLDNRNHDKPEPTEYF